MAPRTALRYRDFLHALATLTCVAASVLAAHSARAAWLEASTDHFIIYTEGDRQSAQAFAVKLEQYDSVLRQFFPTPSGGDEGRRSNRLRVYVLPNAAEVRKLAGGGGNGLLGFYSARASGSVAFTPRHAGDGSKLSLNATNVLLHEYAHHYMFSNFKAAYPTWYSEGFAEFCGSAQFAKDGSINFGMPAYGRMETLVLGIKVPLQKLLEVSVDQSGREITEALYARGWLLTHLLMFKPERRGQLATYLNAVNSGTTGIDAARTAFGDLNKLDRELDVYLSGSIAYSPVRPEQLVVGEVTVRPLSEGESAMMPVWLRSTGGVNSVTARTLIPEARRVANRYPEDAVVQSQLAEAEFDARNLPEADAAADRSLARDPKNLHSLLYKGHIAAALAATSKDAEGWRTARDWYVRANSVEMNSAAALMYFYDTFRGAGIAPSPNAIAALSRAFELAPEAPELRMRFAIQALHDGKTSIASATLAPLAYEPHGGGFTQRVGDAMRHIETGDTASALRVLTAAEAPETP
jgi:tetratricopeptide (TPR) repeat protein